MIETKDIIGEYKTLLKQKGKNKLYIVSKITKYQVYTYFLVNNIDFYDRDQAIIRFNNLNKIL